MGAQIPETGGRLFWTGTNAAIPNRGVIWEEDAAFADRYLQGDDVSYSGPANAGGIHTHVTSSHTHDPIAHEHTFSGSSTSFSHVHADFTGVGRKVNLSDDAHGHPTVKTTPSATITYSTDAANFDGDETHPEHVRIIVLKIVAAAGDQDIPDDAVVLSNNTDLPAGFTKLAALNGKFLRAVSSGGDSALGGAGSATHQHLHNLPGHGHTASAHVHTGVAAGDSDFIHSSLLLGTPSITSHGNAHHTSVSMDSVTTGGLSIVFGLSDTSSSEPAFIKLLPLQNTSGGDKVPVGGSTIIPFVAASGAIPSGWSFYASGDSLQVKCTTIDGEVEDTGGANAHTHTSSHSHAEAAHQHEGTATTSSLSALAGSHPDDVISVPGHTHSWTSSSVAATVVSSGPTLDSQDKRAAYRTVIWIQKTGKRVTLGTIHKTSKEVLAA